jgi:hypothetical protein
MPAKAGTIRLERIEDATISIPIVGVTPLIPHKWSEKALGMMREKQFGKTLRAKKEPKDPKEDAEAATYWLADGRPGMPATAFKAAMVEGCRFFEAPSMTEAKRMLYVEGEGVDQLVAVEGEKTLREDTPRNATGVADLRYRYAFWPWSAVVVIRYPAKRLTPDSVVALLDAGGRSGVGDWRPGSPKSMTGVFGTFRVRDEG